jgi:hypothetical protein
VAIPTSQGFLTVEGAFTVLMQDGRGTGNPFFRIRLMFDPGKGTIRAASLTATVSLKQPKAMPLDIRSAANMGFRDETDGDRTGGWTDQGDNDIRMLPTGPVRFATIPFHIIKPETNGGKSCLVFAGPGRDYFPREASVPVAAGPFECLYLLHATAWTPKKDVPVGDVVVGYGDGTETRYVVTVGRDVGNWFLPTNLDNGVIGWDGANPRSHIGLYVTKIPLEPRAVRSVRLVASGKAVWMVAGMSAGENVPVWREGEREYIFPDENWRAFEHRVTTEPGSVLDFSSLLDGPAGKYGPVIAKDGHFAFRDAPETRIRFYGTNICSRAGFQDKAGDEELVAELARKGYNSARLHHFGALLPFRKGNSSAEFDPAELDKLDYLFYCLKKKGLYIIIDLYTTRTVRKGEIAEIDRDVRLNEFKALVGLSPSAMRNWKTYARNLLTHRNPYTGLAWKDDPALTGICLLNEANLAVHWRTAPDIQELYRERYESWLKGRGVSPDDAPIGGPSPSFTQFIVELNRKMNSECADFVRSLGTTALITELNYRQTLPLDLMREPFDYVDNHVYWDLKRFLAAKWKLPYGHRQQKDTARAAYTPRLAMPTRLFGKPFTITEFNYCFPNHYRAEGGPVMGAYAALQDWDGLYRYAYAHDPERTHKPKALFYLENVSDPINVLSDRIGVLLFLRGDAGAATTRVPYVYSDDILHADGMFSSQGRAGEDATKIGLFYQLGGVNASRMDQWHGAPFAVACKPTWPTVKGRERTFEDAPELLATLAEKGLVPPALHQPGTDLYTSETGQLRLEPGAGTFSIVTPRTECFVLAPGMERTGTSVTVRNSKETHAVLCVSAMDGQPLATSRRLLVIHLTDVMNTGIRFDTAEHTVLSDWGKEPILVRRGSVDVTIRGANGSTIHALDVGGARRWQVPGATAANALSFTASTFQKQGTCLVYEAAK